MRSRVLVSIAAVAAGALAGCGGGDSGGPADVAPAGSPVFVEATVRPEGDLKANIDSLVREVAGISDAGAALIVALNQRLGGAGDQDNLTYADDIEPWLGETAGLFLRDFDGEELQGAGFAAESTDDAAAQKFVDRAAQSNDDPVRGDSYQGVDFKVDRSDGSALGVIDGFVVFGEDVQTFKRAVDASRGDSLADEEKFEDAFSDLPDGSFADAFVDVGELVSGAEGRIDPQVRQILSALGIDPDNATVSVSLVPGLDQIELTVNAAPGGEPPSTSGAPELLGSFPADSLAAFAAAGLADELKSAVGQIDRSGVEGTLPQGGLEGGAALAGIDLDEVLAAVDDAGLFVTGERQAALGGALAVRFDDADLPRNVAVSLGRLLRGTGATGVSLIGGRVAGFTVRSAELGRKPAAVLASGDRLAIGYGVPQTRQALGGGRVKPLSSNDSFKAAESSLGDTPITGFVDVRAALRLAAALGASRDQGFAVARQYLEKGRYVAFGSGEDGDRVTTRIVIGIR